MVIEKKKHPAGAGMAVERVPSGTPERRMCMAGSGATRQGSSRHPPSWRFLQGLCVFLLAYAGCVTAPMGEERSPAITQFVDAAVLDYGNCENAPSDYVRNGAADIVFKSKQVGDYIKEIGKNTPLLTVYDNITYRKLSRECFVEVPVYVNSPDNESLHLLKIFAVNRHGKIIMQNIDGEYEWY